MDVVPDTVPMHARPKWQRAVATAAYAMLRDDYERRRHRPATLAELAELVFDRRESSLIAIAEKRGQVPAGVHLQRLRGVSTLAARLADLIPAIDSSTPTADLRELFASTMMDLSASASAADLARTRDIVFAPGAVRALRSSRWVSRLILEVLLLRRRAERDAINLVLTQGWYVAAALLDCVFRFPALQALATPVWLAITDTLLPDMDSVKRYGGVVDIAGEDLSLDERQRDELTGERVRLQTCVTDALSLADTPLRMRHLFPESLGLELYFHLAYRLRLSHGDDGQFQGTASDRVCLVPPSAERAQRTGYGEAGYFNENTRRSDGRPRTIIEAATRRAPRALVPRIEPRFVTPVVRVPTKDGRCVRPRRKLRPLGDPNLEPIPLDEYLTNSFRVSDVPVLK